MVSVPGNVGGVGSNIFILISGYFMVKKPPKLKKVIMIIIQMIFYGVATYLFSCVYYAENIQIIEIVKKFFFMHGGWWFAKAYIVMCLLVPWISYFANNISKDLYLKLIVLMTIIWVVFPTITDAYFESGNLILFFYLFLIGGYLRLYKDKMIYPIKDMIMVLVILTGVTFLAVRLFDLWGIQVKFLGFWSSVDFFYGNQKIPIVLLSVILFLLFKQLKIKNSSIINIASATTFGIYLIHDNENIRQLLWRDFFIIPQMSSAKYFIPYSLLIVLIVFLVCGFLEFIRMILIEPLYSTKIEHIGDKIINSFEIMMSKLKTFI